MRPQPLYVRAASTPATKRRSMRLVPTTDIAVAIAGLGVELTLRDLSFGGFAVTASRPFWRGMTHRFTFSNRQGFSADLVAKAVHCYKATDAQGDQFVTGWEFMPGTPDATDAAIGRLIEAATAEHDLRDNVI